MWESMWFSKPVRCLKGRVNGGGALASGRTRKERRDSSECGTFQEQGEKKDVEWRLVAVRIELDVVFPKLESVFGDEARLW